MKLTYLMNNHIQYDKIISKWQLQRNMIAKWQALNKDYFSMRYITEGFGSNLL